MGVDVVRGGMLLFLDDLLDFYIATGAVISAQPDFLSLKRALCMVFDSKNYAFTHQRRNFVTT